MARTTYEDAITHLNSCSLRQSLQLASLLSAVEFEGGFNSPFSSLLNSESARLVAEAVIKSRAMWYKTRPLGPSDLPILLNGAQEALEDRRLTREVVSGGERQEMLYNLQRYLSRLAYIQIRPQQTSFDALGRTLAILESIPANHVQEFPRSLQQRVSLFPGQVKATFGLNISELVATHLNIIGYFGRLGQLLLRGAPVSPEGRRFSARQQADVLRRLIVRPNDTLDLLRLTEARLGDLAGERFSGFLRYYASIFGRPITVHRELLGRKEFRTGPDGHRLSPLDRFPLVAAEGGGGWYVPNLRGFARSAPEVLHFALNETCREDYEAVRGALLEVYLRLMLENRAPDLIVIPEKRWLTRKGGADGPDLLVIDHSVDPVVLAVEVKSLRMVPETRYELPDRHLAQRYAPLLKALKQLPDKISKILSLSGEYDRYRSDLIKARNYPVYYVGVAGEAPYLFGELVECQRLRDPEFPLYGFDAPYAVMSVDTFERMFEVSVQLSRPIASVLREYSEDCKNIEVSSPMAENFRHHVLDENEAFGFSFLRPIWPESQ